MENLTLRLRTPKPLPKDLEKRARELKELARSINSAKYKGYRVNVDHGNVDYVNLASNPLGCRNDRGYGRNENGRGKTRIGAGFWSSKEIELQFTGNFNPLLIYFKLRDMGFKILEIRKPQKKKNKEEDKYLKKQMEEQIPYA